MLNLNPVIVASIFSMCCSPKYTCEYEIYLRNDKHYLRSSENKACTGFEPMTSVIPVQRSTNWAKTNFEYMKVICLKCR